MSGCLKNIGIGLLALFVIFILMAVAGVKESRSEQPPDFDIRWSDFEIEIVNNDRRYQPVMVRMVLNGQYEFQSYLSSGPNRFGTAEFVKKDGTRFSGLTTKLLRLEIYSLTDGRHDYRFDYVWSK